MPRKRADEVQPGEYVRLNGDSHIEKIGKVEPARTLNRVCLILGLGGRGYYEFANEEILDVGVERTEHRLTYQLANLGLSFKDRDDCDQYVDHAVNTLGEHVRAQYRVQTRETLVFATDWTDA